MELVRDSSQNLQLLSELLFAPHSSANLPCGYKNGRPESNLSLRLTDLVSTLSVPDLEELRSLAMTNHVIVRCFEPLAHILEIHGKAEGAGCVMHAVEEEQKRIERALQFLSQICAALEDAGCPAIVIKSLDHWPDLGSDLDLYTDSDAGNVLDVMRSKFNAKVDGRSWGDRLANKWNFEVPGLPELVEIHIGRLGQTGEQTAVTGSISMRKVAVNAGSYSFRVPSPEDRIVISTLQRMYRHFYIRLCDIADNARLLDANAVDFEYLHSLGSEAGLWDGIATYLKIVSDYVEAYRGYGPPLSFRVTAAAKFGTEKVSFRKAFLRVPLLPQSLNLYAEELKTLLRRGDLRNSLRLSLLPGLATAAALEQKLTGSDKGVW